MNPINRDESFGEIRTHTLQDEPCIVQRVRPYFYFILFYFIT